MPRIKIYSWNVNGIRAVHRKGALAWFLRDRPDILCLQETKAQPDQLPDELSDIAGYRKCFVSAERKGYSGVGVFTRRRPEAVIEGLGIERFDREGRTVIIDYGKFVLFNIYYPNGKASKERLAYKMDFYEAFLEVAVRYRDEGRNLVICGDVNTAHRAIDLARPQANIKVSGFLPEERAWMDRFLAAGFVDTFRMFNDSPDNYTWWDMKSRARDRNVGWRIDYFFVNEAFRKNVRGAAIHADIEGSDHCPVSIDIAV
ncbi:MAG: exodeoxyribonuclease III [candidate division Zixibacteria bacterium]|nr:exodeoxyribonuclease III [candidate division Zixibacteria bacterium]